MCYPVPQNRVSRLHNRYTHLRTVFRYLRTVCPNLRELPRATLRCPVLPCAALCGCPVLPCAALLFPVPQNRCSHL
jgi:hypothetical protein